jgi:hypothetical protein
LQESGFGLTGSKKVLHMAYVLARRTTTLHPRVVSYNVGEQRYYGTKAEKRKVQKPKKKQPVEENKGLENVEGQPSLENLTNLIDTFGVGKSEGSTQWRDQKLDYKVLELFKATVEWAEVNTHHFCSHVVSNPEQSYIQRM